MKKEQFCKEKVDGKYVIEKFHLHKSFMNNASIFLIHKLPFEQSSGI